MKIVRKLLAVVLALLSLASLFIIICAFRPGLADQAASFLYQNQKEKEEPSPVIPPAGEAVVEVPKGEGAMEGAKGEGEAAVEDTEGESGETAGLKPSSLQPEENVYLPPGKEQIEVPEEVTGRGGYLPVEGTVESGGPEETTKTQEPPDYGSTGDSLSFDEEYYPYYGMLEESAQRLYRQIYANACALKDRFTPVEAVDAGTLRNVFQAVYNDHPELFWLDTVYRARLNREGRCAKISLTFNRTADELPSAREAFEAAASEIVDGAANLGSEAEKERYVHDALLGRIDYSLHAPMNQSAYSALVNGQTVCAGYARAFQYVMNLLSIPCYYCTGFAGQNHAWNIIRLDGEYYNVDLTWDDTDPATLTYYNRTDEDFAGTHIRQELSVYLPPCNGKKYAGPEQTEEEAALSDGEAYRTDINDVTGERKRTPEEAGVTQETVFTRLEDYYEYCYGQTVNSEEPVVRFHSVLKDRSLWEDCFSSFQSGAYEKAWVEDALFETGASSLRIGIQMEELSDGSCILEHEISLYYPQY